MPKQPRRQRESAAREKIRQALDRDKARSAFKAAGAREIDDQALEAASALSEERLARIASRAAEIAEERNEDSVSAASVAIAAEREREPRLEPREEQ
jgi:hypothetical protein